MRTAIFLGLTAIADAIRYDWVSKDMAGILAVIFLVMMFMDVMEFIVKIKHKIS